MIELTHGVTGTPMYVSASRVAAIVPDFHYHAGKGKCVPSGPARVLIKGEWITVRETAGDVRRIVEGAFA
jgi:hypothetical protein